MRIAAALLILLFQAPATPADIRAHVARWTTANQRAIVTELADLLAIPNVAADRPNIIRNVEFLERAFARRGFTTRRLETTGNPLFFAERATPGASKTTLIYIHV